MFRLQESCCPLSQKLLAYIQKWNKNPLLDEELSEAIDDFRRQQAQSDGLCSNGLSSYNFAEAALFVQNWATLYDKKVNLLLKHLIRLHSALCDVSTRKDTENATGTTDNAVPSTSRTEPMDIAIPSTSRTDPVDNAIPSTSKTDTTENESAKQKRKKKKIEPTPETIDPDIAVPPPVPSAEQADDAYSSKELQEIGILWNMLEKYEKKQIERILNNIVDDDDNYSDREETVQLNSSTEKTSSEIPSTSAELNKVKQEPTKKGIENCAADSSIKTEKNIQDDIKIPIDKTVTINDTEAKIECLQQVQIRLKYLSEEVLKKYKVDDIYDFKGFPKESSICTGCKALRDYMKLEKQKLRKMENKMERHRKSETEEQKKLKKKVIIKQKTPFVKMKDCYVLLSTKDIVKKSKSRKRLNTSSSDDEPLLKKPRKSISVWSDGFEKFYDTYYSKLLWQDGTLNYPEIESMDQESIQNEAIINNNVEPSNEVANNVIENIENVIEMDTEQITDEHNEETTSTDKEEGTSAEKEDSKTDKAEVTSTNKEFTTTDKEVTNADVHQETPNDICGSSKSSSDVLDSSQSQSTSLEPMSTSLDTTNEKSTGTLSEPVGTTIIEEVELSHTFEFPHTPAASEDSGRFSASACHSDISEIHLLNVTQDSGIDICHNSDFEDEAVCCTTPAPQTPPNPFKGMEPERLKFYKMKCEILLHQKERDEKVKEWKTFLEKKKTNLPEFDIREHEDKILKKLPEKKKKVSFGSVISGKSKAEVARNFAACLQLANMGNVKIKNEKPGKLSKDGIKIECLTKEKYEDKSVNLELDFIRGLERNTASHSTPTKSQSKNQEPD